MKIYTKTGDTGETALYGGQRLMKSDLRIEAYGNIDELNSHIGLLRDYEIEPSRKSALSNIQNALFTTGAHLAASPLKPNLKLPEINTADVEILESEIDRMEESLIPLQHFILPGGHPEVSACHIARCVCRRAERSVIALHLHSPVNPVILQFINRLSDFLFVLARHKAFLLKVQEIPWIQST